MTGLDEQAQVLAANVYLKVCKLPKKVVQDLVSYFPSQSNLKSAAVKVASGLLCMSGNGLRTLIFSVA